MKKEIDNFVGKKAIVWLGGLHVEVKVIDVKSSYGRNRYLITPIAGKGEVWIEKVEIIK